MIQINQQKMQKSLLSSGFFRNFAAMIAKCVCTSNNTTHNCQNQYLHAIPLEEK